MDGDLPLYSRAPGDLDTIGIQPLIWGSAQELRESLEFLRQRRRLTALSNSGGLFWAWIPATAPADRPGEHLGGRRAARVGESRRSRRSSFAS